ncbi:MAG: O-antigen ligase family protein [Gemmatimonadota bacterium]
MGELRDLLFPLFLLLAFFGGIAAGMSTKIQRVLFALLLLTTMRHIADIQLGYDQDFIGRQRGTVWGFRFTFNDMMAIPLYLGLFVGSLVRPDGFRWFPRGSLAIWLLFAAEVVSLTAANEVIYGLYELNNVLLGFIVFAAVANFIRTENDLRFATVLLVLAAAIPAAVGFKQHFQFLLGQPYISRVTGTTVHPNLLSMYLNMLLPLCLVLGLTVQRWTLRIALFGICLVGAASVMFTVSRGGVAALAFGYGVATGLWLLFSRTGNKPLKLVMLILFLVPVGVKWSPLLFERMESANAKASSRGRQALTDRGFEIWRTSPVVGVGVNNYAHQENTANVHNTYVLYLAELGVVGLSALILLFAAFFLNALRNVWRAPPRSLLRIVNMGVAAGLASLYLQLYAEFAIRSENIHYLFFIFGGIIAGSHYLVRSSREPEVQAAPARPKRRALEPVGAPL